MTSSNLRSVSPHRYGRLAETWAVWWLRLHGYRLVARNLRVAGRELDIVARRGHTLVVCEVKARRALQPASEAVSPRQAQRLRDAAELLLAREPWARSVRLDLIAVSGLRVRHFRSAF